MRSAIARAMEAELSRAQKALPHWRVVLEAELSRAQKALPHWRVVLTPTGYLLATRQPGTQWAEARGHSADHLIEGCRHIERAEPAAAAPPMQYR